MPGAINHPSHHLRRTLSQCAIAAALIGLSCCASPGTDGSQTLTAPGTQAPTPIRRDYTIPQIALEAHPECFTTVDRQAGRYLGQPTSVLFKDGQTVLAAYPDGHGHGRLILSRSTDAGRTWRRIGIPPQNVDEVPVLHKITLPDGRERVVLFTCRPQAGILEWMWSDDCGGTWSPRQNLRLEGTRGAIVALASLWPADATGTRHRGVFHDFNFDNHTIDLVVKPDGQGGYDCVMENLAHIRYQTPAGLDAARAAGLCEAGVAFSPDRKRLALLMRPQNKKTNAMICFSDDMGKTWSDPREMQGSLTGERHVVKTAPDGRLVVCFRDYSPLNPGNPSHGDWVAWVGTWDDLVRSQPGQYRIRLHRNVGNSTNDRIGDCGYTGLEVLPDGTFLAISYGHWEAIPHSTHPNHAGGRGQSPFILAARFKLADTDAWVEAEGGGKK